MISEAVYEQVVAELDEVRHAWQNNLREVALVKEQAEKYAEDARYWSNLYTESTAVKARLELISRAERAEAELQEALKEIEVRKRELKTCQEQRRFAEEKLENLSKSKEI